MQGDNGEVALEELMTQYQQASADSAATLIELLSPKLYGFFAAPMGNRSEADDMLQEVWLRIHRVRHTYRPSEPLLPWIYAIARRVRIDNYRKRSAASREIPMEALPEHPTQEDQTTAPLAFESLLATLPESQREVIRLLKVDGLSVDEVARATASTAGAVKQKAHRAYERL